MMFCAIGFAKDGVVIPPDSIEAGRRPRRMVHRVDIAKIVLELPRERAVYFRRDVVMRVASASVNHPLLVPLLGIKHEEGPQGQAAAGDGVKRDFNVEVAVAEIHSIHFSSVEETVLRSARVCTVINVL